MSMLEEEFYFQAVHNLPPDEPTPHAHLFKAVFEVEVEDTDTIRVRHEHLRERLAPLCFELQRCGLINDQHADLDDGSMEAISGWLMRRAPALLKGLPAEFESIRLGMASTDDRGTLCWHWITRP